jgi:hypothetical protein
MARTLTEAEAWREIGRRYETGDVSGGLCKERDRLLDGLRFGHRLHDAMYDRVQAHRVVHHGPRGWFGQHAYEEQGDWDPEHNGARALAAYWLALEAEEESR